MVVQPKRPSICISCRLQAADCDVELELWADPAATCNRHEIQIEGHFGRATIDVVNEPSPDNPATSQLAAMSLLALLNESWGDPRLHVGN